MKCKSMNYAWGQQGASSLVSKILTHNSLPFDNNKPYAEYWMGTHINGPSEVYTEDSSTQLISILINKDLPYLFKVLSIEKPLSIQIHPDIPTATLLNKSHPDIYKDANHKPELFIVISETFELLFGFKSLQRAYNTVLEFKEVFSFKEAKDFINSKSTNMYKNLIDKLMTFSESESSTIINQLIELSKLNNNENCKLIQLLYNNFGDDFGIIIALFMNHIFKTKGDSMYIVANTPHAYIHGNCYEVMSNSDNVIRLGLTKKFVDRDTFKRICDEKFDEMLYEPSLLISDHIKTNKNEVTYHKDKIDDFILKAITIDKVTKMNIDKETVLFIDEGNVEIHFDKNKINAPLYSSYFIPKELKDVNIKVINEDKAKVLLVSEYIN